MVPVMMRFLERFKMADTLLARYKIAQKLLVSSAVLALPIAVLLYFVVAGFNTGISAAQKEISGSRRMEPLRQAAVDLRAHERLMYYALKGDNRWGDRREEVAKRIDQALANFQKVADDAEKGPAARVSTRWQEFRRKPPTSATESANAHQQLSASIQDLMRSVGDSSMLVLDPDLDSYYLMQLSVVLLPEAQETVGQATMLADVVTLEGQISQRDLMRFAVYADALEYSILPRVRHAAEVSLREDARYHGTSKTLQQNLPALLSSYQADLTKYSDAMRRYAQMTDANLAPSQVAAFGARAEQTGSEFWQTSAVELRKLLDRRISDNRWRRAAALFLGFLALVLAAAAVTLVARNITRPLGEVVRLASEIARGEVKEARKRLEAEGVREMLAMSKTGAAQDEMCVLVGAISHMTDSLDSLLAQVSRAGAQVAGSAAQIGAAVRELESTVAEQAASTNQVSATSREIFATVQQLARTMAAVSQAASEAADSATGGVGSLDRIHAAIEGLLAAGEGLTSTLDTIADRARNVDAVITAITKVANRTNLLSLNAAIEAEKAGDAAGGFSVVAVEIRRLADQTAMAALDIEALIQEMQGAVREGVDKVEEYAEQTRTSSGAVNALSTGLGRVIESTQKLGPQFETVNQGMQSQSQGAGQIADAMGHLRDSAQHTRDSLAEFRRVAEQLHAAVDALQAEVGRFSTAA